jgi:hypothetical protein
MRKRHASRIGIVGMALAAAVAGGRAFAASPNIVAASSTLQPNLAGQQVQFLVSGIDSIAGEDLTFEINDGTSGPTITAVNILTGTIFAANNTGQNGFGIPTSGTYTGRVAIASTTTNSGTVVDNGLLATLTISTVGMSSGSLQINVLNTINGNSDFVLPDASTITPFQPFSKLVIGDANRTWIFNGGGTWNLDSHWTPFAPYTIGDIANFFGAVTTGTATVTLDGDRVIGALNFNNTNASYDLEPGTGGTLSFNNGAAAPVIVDSGGSHTVGVALALMASTNVTVTRAADTLTITGNIAGGSTALSLTGAGKMVLAGTNVYGNTVINSGNVQIGNGGTTGSLGTGSVIDNGLLLWDRSDSANLAAPISGNGGLSILTPVTLTITGLVNITGPATVGTAGGKLVLTGALTHNLGTIGGPGALQVNSGTTLISNGVTLGGSWVINGNQKIRLGAGDPGTSRVTGVPVIGATSQLDLADSHLIVQSSSTADKTTKIASLNALVLSGSSGGTWTGPGIISSVAAGDANHYGVGVFDNAIVNKATFGGQAVDTGSILTAVAHLGDANDSGDVDIQDQSLVTNNWQLPKNNWAGGDLNGDGFVDIQDLTIVTNNWQQHSSFPLGAVGGGGAVVAVPEPGSLAVLGVAAWAVAGRRGRRARR